MTTDVQTQELMAHPYAELFPMMEKAAFDRLAADIKKNGLLEPIIIYQGQILDGRNRARACREVGVEPDYETWDGPGDPLSYVLGRNLHRRHLTTSERALIAARIARHLGESEAPDNDTVGEPSANLHSAIGNKAEAAADMVNISPRTAKYAIHLQAEGIPELVSMVERGEVSVTAASEVAKLPAEDQQKVVEGGSDAVREVAQKARNKSKDGAPERGKAHRDSTAPQATAPSPEAVEEQPTPVTEPPEADKPDAEPDDLQPQPTYTSVLIDDREPPTDQGPPSQDALPAIDPDAGQVWIRFRPDRIDRAMRIAEMCQTRPFTLFTAIRTDTTPAQVVEHALVAVRGSPTFGDDLANLPKVTVLPTDDTFPFERLMESCAGVPRHRIDLWEATCPADRSIKEGAHAQS